MDMAQFPLNFFVYPAMLFSLKKRVNNRLTVLLLLAFFAHGFGIAIAFIDRRLLLPCAPIASIFAAYGFYKFLPDFPARGTWPRRAAQAGFALLFIWMFMMHDRPLLSMNEWDRMRIEVSALLNRSGMKSSHEVLSFSLSYYNLESRKKENFATNTPPAPFIRDDFVPYKSVDDIADRMKSEGQQYLVFDSYGVKLVKGLNKIWPFDEAAMDKRFVRLGSFKTGTEVWRLRTF
jgi:hypothetical protein